MLPNQVKKQRRFRLQSNVRNYRPTVKVNQLNLKCALHLMVHHDAFNSSALNVKKLRIY